MSDLTSRPFVINRDVEVDTTDERKVLIDFSEYDGMVESPSVQPLNRYTAMNALNDWECDEDYIIDNENGHILFAMQYHKSDGTPVVVAHRIGEGEGTLADYHQINLLKEQTFLDLDEPGTVVHDLKIMGNTARKMWYRVETDTLDFSSEVPT